MGCPLTKLSYGAEQRKQESTSAISFVTSNNTSIGAISLCNSLNGSFFPRLAPCRRRSRLPNFSVLTLPVCSGSTYLMHCWRTTLSLCVLATVIASITSFKEYRCPETCETTQKSYLSCGRVLPSSHVHADKVQHCMLAKFADRTVRNDSDDSYRYIRVIVTVKSLLKKST